MKAIKDDDTAKKKLVEEYLNNLVTTINPGIDSPVPEQHPCQKRHNEIANNEQDYIDLINKLQCHTRCSPSYCLQVNKDGQQSCRFGYPKENVEQSYLRDDECGQPEFVTARNDPLINTHSEFSCKADERM